MQPNPQFSKQPKAFWANVRTISQGCGYTNRGTHEIHVPNLKEICELYESLELSSEKIVVGGKPTALGQKLLNYFAYRAKALNTEARQNLMNVAEAKALFEKLMTEYHYKLELVETKRGKIEAFLVDPKRERFQIAMNKQKAAKKAPAYLTAMVAMLVRNTIGAHPCDFNPMELTSVTRDNIPLRTLARRVDGAFPRVINPIAIWEIKEYYYTTTFGSRVADGVYESLLDGLELEELRENEKVDVKHYLILDDSRTWWKDGRSYLCRIVDMLNMGYVDEIFFGKEIVEGLPRVATEWLKHPALKVPLRQAEKLL